MKRSAWKLAVLAGLCSVTELWAQGPLTPPGAPAPTMKTLDQVEPRTPIASAPYTISQPGSYYFTTNLNATITIAANDVTLDLMGFTISPVSGSAITMTGVHTNLVVHNGTVRSSGATGSGLFVSSFKHGLLENLRVENWNVFGINAGYNMRIRNCEIYGNGYGIYLGGNDCEVSDCRIAENTIGLYITGNDNAVKDNMVKNNTDNYNLVTGNRLNLLLCEVPETLDWPCSVTFAGSLTCSATGTNGITVNADDVTIDLGGHALVGPGAGSGHGIFQAPEYHNLTVRNGSVMQWLGGFKSGLYMYGSNCRVTGIHTATNYNGITFGLSGSISDCQAVHNLNDGINGSSDALVSHCTADDNGLSGIYVYSGKIMDCSVNRNAGRGIHASGETAVSGCSVQHNETYGIYLPYGSHVSDCIAAYNGSTGINSGGTVVNSTASSNGSDGFDVLGNIVGCLAEFNNSTGIRSSEGGVSSCSALNNSGYGIDAIGGAYVFDCTVVGNSGGILVSDSRNRIENNVVNENGNIGINVTTTQNIILRNSATGNKTNYLIVANNRYGPIIDLTASGTAAVSGNSAASTVTTTDPWANFAR